MESPPTGQDSTDGQKDTSAAQPVEAAPESAQPATPAPEEAERAAGQDRVESTDDNPETDTDGEDVGSPEPSNDGEEDRGAQAE